MRVASSARSIRPPSIGKAGIRLKPATMRLANVSRPSMLPPGLRIWSTEWRSSIPAMTSTSTAAIATLMTGPASATASSSPDFSGMRSSIASPPIGSTVTSGVAMP